MAIRLAHPRRYQILRHIRTLDPQRDRDEIAWWDVATSSPGTTTRARHRVPARLRHPAIARLLDRTGEFENDGVKRYDDTLIFGEEAVVEGIDSERAPRRVRRLNRIHGHYDIPNDEFQYVLATTIVGPVRWIRRYGWRDARPGRAGGADHGSPPASAS